MASEYSIHFKSVIVQFEVEGIVYNSLRPTRSQESRASISQYLLPLDASSSCETSTACQNTVTVVSKLGRSFDN